MNTQPKITPNNLEIQASELGSPPRGQQVMNHARYQEVYVVDGNMYLASSTVGV